MKKVFTRITILLLLIISSKSVIGQNGFRLYGDVNFEGKPLPGVSITLKNFGATSSTDSSGHFWIFSKNAKDTLVLTHVGFKTAIKPISDDTKQPVHIVMEPITTNLKEVVVSSGYQEIPKERATGSYFKIDKKLLDQRVSPDIISRLDGVSSGVLFDNHDANAQTIQIRGLSSHNYANLSPLIILDNFPYAGDINNINPNDIESITVLKDAAATSIWGAKAGNGVIVIDTKKAKANQPLSLTLSSNITLSPKINLYSARTASVNNIIELQKQLFTQGFYDSNINSPYFSPIPPVADILNRAKNGEITNAQAESAINVLRGQDVRSDMEKYLYRGEVKQQYYANISGSARSYRYIFSAGYDKNLASLVGNDNNRITIRSNQSIEITKDLLIQSDIILTKNTARQNSPGGFGSYSTGTNAIAPYARLINPDGSPAAIDLYYSRAFTDTAGNGKLLDWKYRPLQNLHENNNTSGQTDVLVNLSSTYRILPWLKVDAKYQYDKTSSWVNNDQNMNTYGVRDYINTFTSVTNNQLTYYVPKGNILSTQNGNILQQAGRAQLDFDKTWNSKHEFHAIAGGEIRENTSSVQYATTYGYNPNTLTSQKVDYATLHPTYDNIYGSSAITDGTRFTLIRTRFVSAYANASYSYDNRYTLTASARRDASNIFGVSTNNKWVPLWSTGFLWRISNEKFFRSDWLSDLSARFSYGSSGNISPSQSGLTRITYAAASRNPIGLPYVNISSPENPNLRWEQVKTFNAGLDFAFVDKRISGSIDYYTKNSKDLVNSVLLDPTVGFNSANLNSASIFGKGLELILNSDNLQGSLKWTSSFLFNYSNYKTTKLLNPPSAEGLVSSGTYIFPIVGYNPYQIVTFKWAGLNPQNGNPRGYVNGNVSEDYNAILSNSIDKQDIIGSAVPLFYGNFRNSFSWHDLSLVVNLTYRLKYWFLKPTTNSDVLYNTGMGYPDYDSRWQKSGDEAHTNVPSFVYPSDWQRDNFYQFASINAEKADNIKVNDIYLSYTLKFINIASLKRLEIYAYANQLNWMVWKANKSKLDPDFLYGLKNPMNISLGFKANF